VRPTGGRGGATAAISLDVGGPALLTLDVGPGYASLAPSAGEAWPPLAPLVGKRMPPGSLLAELSSHGMHLLPEDRDAPFVGARVKDASVERAMCAELGLLSGVCLIARARWNSAAAADECIARISEVVDWEEGGRTEQSHADRVFSKEREDGEKRVLSVMARGDRGFAFIDAADKRTEAPGLPGHESVESVQACMESVYGEIHAGLLPLLKGPQYTSEELEAGPLPARLRLSPDALSLSNEASPLLSETVGHTLLLLRVFSFS
jgi:cancer susceptibility candidate protein 1